jgi:glycosyltransferase involved in cell wall biosynthesis
MKKKILFICFTESVHSGRWISQLKDNDEFEIQIFPTTFSFSIHPELKSFNVCIPLFWIRNVIFFFKLNKHINKLQSLISLILKVFFPNFLQNKLSKKLKTFQPHIVHTLETQHAGYLYHQVLSGKSNMNVKWWHSNWGSDIQLFSKIEAHKIKIISLLNKIDYYSCECTRDVDLAYNLGFKGVAFDVYPNTGGFDIQKLNSINFNSLNTSERRVILLKGYQGWAGRSLVGIRALERCSDLLKGYSIKLFSVAPNSIDVQTSVALFIANTGIKMEVLPNNLSHEEMLLLHSSARISIGLSVGDGISTSLLEAMAMGSFPIQSNSSCCNEWFEHGISGFSVNAEDSESIEKVIRLALLNDDLVNSARLINYETIKNNADKEYLRKRTISNYRKILNK